MKQESLAYELLGDLKRTNRRMFIIWIITFVALLGLACYTLWLLNDIESVTTEEIIDIEKVDQIDNSNIQIGDK